MDAGRDLELGGPARRHAAARPCSATPPRARASQRGSTAIVGPLLSLAVSRHGSRSDRAAHRARSPCRRGRGVATPPGSSPRSPGCSKPATTPVRPLELDLDKPFAWVWSAAHRVIADESAPEAERIGAAQLIGYGARRNTKDRDLLVGLVAAPGLAWPPASRRGRPGDEPMIPSSPILLVDWKKYSPSIRNAILDTLLSRTAWTSSLLSSLEDGCVPPAEIDPARRQQLLTQPKRSAQVPRRGRLRPSKPTPAGGRRRLSRVTCDERATKPPAQPSSRSCVPRAIAWATKASRSGPTSPP